MDYFNLDRCIALVNERPKWFFQQEDIAAKIQCFETIRQIGHPSTIYPLINLLRSDQGIIQTKAAETVSCLFKKLKSLNAYSDTLKHLPIEKEDIDSFRVDFEENIFVQLLGIASINSNGFVREKAVQELERLGNPDGLKFILLRLGDWVEPIRKLASKAIVSFFEDRYVNDLLNLLPTIDWLLKVEREDLRSIHGRIIQFLVNRDLSDGFFTNLKHFDDKARFRFIKYLLLFRKLTKEQILKILEDKSFLVRMELLQHIREFDPVTQKEMIAKLLDDPSAAVRQRALCTIRSLGFKFEEKITELLSDGSASVRALCRSFLREEGVDFAQVYRQRVTEKRFLSGSILGLSETGNPNDLPFFETYICDKKHELIVGSLIAINKFRPDTAKQHSIEFLTHRSKRVRDKAAEILAKNYDTPALEKIRGLYAQNDRETRQTILRLFSKIGGWNVIGDLLLSITDKEENIQKLGWQLLELWKLKALRLFTTPPKAELDRALGIYNALDFDKLKLTENRINFLRELKMYLH